MTEGTDICVRLRSAWNDDWLALRREAADEIEQLRTDLSLRDQTARDRKEIIGKLEGENDRLRAQQKGILAENQHWQMDAAKYRSEAEILRVQIDRLRAALHWTAQNCLDQACVKRAMEALEGGT